MYYSGLEAACRPNGFRINLEKLQLWSNFPGNAVRVGGRHLRVDATMAFPGAFISRDSTGPVGHRVGMAWSKFWAAKRHMTTRALSPEARLQRLRAEILPVMTWGYAAWHLRADVIGMCA